MSEHTPGPWTVFVRPFDGTTMVVAPTEQLSVCNVTDYGGMPVDTNAAVLASSLELLAACELALDVFGRELVSRSPTDEEAERFEAIVCLTAAVAKAKGGAS